jgi:hypothetical protein
MTFEDILNIPVKPIVIPASYISYRKIGSSTENCETMLLHLPHYGKRNILIIGSPACMGCELVLHQIGGTMQEKIGCMIYKCDSTDPKNFEILQKICGEKYRIPKIYIEYENNQLIEWYGTTLEEMLTDLTSDD